MRLLLSPPCCGTSVKSLVALLVLALSIEVVTSVGVPCLLFVLLEVPIVVAASLDSDDELDDDELDDKEEPFSSLLAETSGSKRTLCGTSLDSQPPVLSRCLRRIRFAWRPLLPMSLSTTLRSPFIAFTSRARHDGQCAPILPPLTRALNTSRCFLASSLPSDVGLLRHAETRLHI